MAKNEKEDKPSWNYGHCNNMEQEWRTKLWAINGNEKPLTQRNEGWRTERKPEFQLVGWPKVEKNTRISENENEIPTVCNFSKEWNKKEKRVRESVANYRGKEKCVQA